MPERIGVDKPARLFSCRQRVGAGNAISSGLEFIESEIQPTLFSWPVGNRRLHSLFENLLRDDRVVGQFHLVDRDGIRLKFKRAPNHITPFFLSLANHAGYQVDIDLRRVYLASKI